MKPLIVAMGYGIVGEIVGQYGNIAAFAIFGVVIGLTCDSVIKWAAKE